MVPGNDQHPERRERSRGAGLPRKPQPDQAPSHLADQVPGEVTVGMGRVSAARQVRPVLSTLPFTRSQLAALDDALVHASRGASLQFGIYLGDLGADTRTRAEQLHDSMGARAEDTVLVAVSPGQRVVEVVTGGKASHRLPDRGCKLAVESMVSCFQEGDLTGGLTAGLRILTDQTDSTNHRGS